MSLLQIGVRGPDWRAGGALCIGRWAVWDPPADAEDFDYTTAAAQRECQRCPMLQACGDWLQTLPPYARPFGVTAGVLRRERGERAPYGRRAG